MPEQNTDTSLSGDLKQGRIERTLGHSFDHCPFNSFDPSVKMRRTQWLSGWFEQDAEIKRSGGKAA